MSEAFIKPRHFEDRAVRGIAGHFLGYPWFDRAAVFALRHWFFPASRLWAAARAANGDMERFYEAVPMPGRLENRERLAHALARFETARASVNAIETEWDRVFFGADELDPFRRQAVEAARISLRHAYNATRRHFRFLVSRNCPRVRPAIATPDEVEAIYGEAMRLDRTSLTRAQDTSPKIEVSRPIPAAWGRDYWLRFDSPSERLGDKVYARVHEPDEIADPPTIIFGHGICVEFDHWHGLIDECHALAHLGFRVIRPEAPWHGRRTLPGSFGGERIIAAFPLGTLDAILGAVREWAVLADWARTTSRGVIAFGGSSLGAMTAQLAADKASEWPERLRPDALLLLTHTRDLTEAVGGGTLARLFLDPKDVLAMGWTESRARDALSVLEPEVSLSVAPRNIVSVLGKRDQVLPFESGRSLVEQWGVPEENLFVWDRGHFSVPMTLIRDSAPLKRFAEVVRAIR